MKRALLLLAFFCVFLTISPAGGIVETPHKPTAMVVDYTLTPTILNPGDSATLSVTIKEIGTTSVQRDYSDEDLTWSNSTSWADTVYIERVSLEPVGISVLNQPYDHIGQIGSDQSLPLTFYIRAPSNPGVYFPEVRITTDGGVSRFPIPVNVGVPVSVQKQAILVFNNTFPDAARPGDDIPVRVTIRNDGATLADETLLTLDTEYPGIAPRSANKFFIGQILPGEQKSVDMVFATDRNIYPGLHQIPVSIRYDLVDGSAQKESALITVVTKGCADLAFTAVNSSPGTVTAGQPFDITVSVENEGRDAADDVRAAIDLPFHGKKEAYLGRILPGNEVSATFMLDGGAEGSYRYNATVTYADGMGTHTELRQSALRVNADPYLWLKLLIALAAGIGILGAFCRYGGLPKSWREWLDAWRRKS